MAGEKHLLLEKANREIESILSNLEETTNRRVRIVVYNGDRRIKNKDYEYESDKIILDFKTGSITK